MAAFAVSEVIRAERLGTVVACTAALLAGRREVHRHGGCAHLTSAGSATYAVAACAAHPLIHMERVAEIDAVGTRGLGCTRQSSLLVTDVARGHREGRTRAVALEASVVSRRPRGDRESGAALVRLMACRTRDTQMARMDKLPAKGLEVWKALHRAGFGIRVTDRADRASAVVEL